MIVNKFGDVVKIVEPITFVWHLQDLSPSCNRRCVRTWLRCYFNVIVLAANEKASPKFSTDYINDIEKWPRTPLKLGEDPKAALAIQMCQDVTRMYQLQPPLEFQLPDAVPIAKATYLAAKATLAAARSGGVDIYEDAEDKEPMPEPVEYEDSESSSDEDLVQLAGGRRRHRPHPPSGVGPAGAVQEHHGVASTSTSHPDQGSEKSDAGKAAEQPAGHGARPVAAQGALGAVQRPGTKLGEGRAAGRPATSGRAAVGSTGRAGSSRGSHTQGMTRAKTSPNHPDQKKLHWAARKRMHDCAERAARREDLAFRRENGIGGKTMPKKSNKKF